MVFVDTGPLLARYLTQDARHSGAAVRWSQLKGSTLVTSNHVLDETFTLLGRRAGYSFAADRAEQIFTSKAIEIVYSSREDEVEALRFFRKYADQRVSFTDCVSFALMRRHRVRTAFTFDSHFALVGFETIA